MGKLSLLLLSLLLGLTAACSSADEDLQTLQEYQDRATRYYEASDLARAEQQALLGLQIDPDHPTLNLILGRTLLKWRDVVHVAQSKQYLEKAYDEDPSFRTAYSLGEFHERYSELLLDTANSLESRAGELGPDEANAAQELRDRAEKQRKAAHEHLLTAQRLLEEALQGNPKYIYALRLAANCYSLLGEDQKALDTLSVLIDQLLASRRWKNERLANLALSIPEEDQLRRSLRDDLKMEIDTRGLAATLYKKEKRYPEAIAELTEILKLDPNLDREYYNRGLCHSWMGDLAAANADMKQFLRLTDLDSTAEEVSKALDIVSDYQLVSSGKENSSTTPAEGVEDQSPSPPPSPRSPSGG